MSGTKLKNNLRITGLRSRHRRPAEVISKNTPGTERCDIMGTGMFDNCRKITRRDLDWIESQAGVQITARPGELLLNKDASRQNMGVGFETKVYAEPGSTTTARGISVYCIDKSRFFPLDEGFDVLGPAREVPGYAPLATLLELSGRIQPSLEETPPGMLNAVWNVTDAASLEFSGSAEQSRALLAQAASRRAPCRMLPALPNPNAGSAETRGGHGRQGAADDQERGDATRRPGPAGVRAPIPGPAAGGAPGAGGPAPVERRRGAPDRFDRPAPRRQALAQGPKAARAQGPARVR